MSTETLLIEIGTEELPPKAAKTLSQTLTSTISDELKQAGINYSDIKSYVSPRRLALSISQCSAQQPDQNVERKGPAVAAAYDDQGEPTKAAQGFARSCGVDMQALETLTTDKGAWLYFKSQVAGQHISELLPKIIDAGLAALPIPRPMRWGDHAEEFVRPVHWLAVMYGSAVVPCTIKGIAASNKTYGHRFHAPAAITLTHADDYEAALNNAYVIADFAQRRTKIISQLDACADKHNAQLEYPESLLEEVTNLVEWPCAIIGDFDSHFLDIPHEALVVTMQDAQRYFPLFDKQTQALLPHFITIANIESSNPDTIKLGNERVIKPRFEDAKFFWTRDQQQSLFDRSKQLKGILFEKQLGSIQQKSQRVQQLVEFCCQQTNLDAQHAVRAAQLCKADLVSDMVNEFPKLQGIMGRYYALNDNEAEAVAIAIEEHYQPIQSGGKLPATPAGKVLAMCDRIDTLVGIFATGKKPTGVKDPYALRRAALGVVRIAIEGDMDFDLHALLSQAAQLLSDTLDTSKTEQDVFDYILERLRGYLIDKGIAADSFEAVRSVAPTHLLDFAARIQAVEHFRTLKEADSLAAGNKRIRNILKKATVENLTIDPALFSLVAENALHEQTTALAKTISPLNKSRQYTGALTELATLRPAIDTFFDGVMVMDDDEAIRNNRIALLASVNTLFATVADISLLQS